MKRQTRRLLLNIATAIAVAAAAALVFLPAVQAAPGEITSNVNVRSGPGTSYRVIDTLVRGTSVDVGQCRASFCQVRTRNVSGWVSANYLRTGGRVVPGQGSGNGFSFGFSIGPNGPRIGVGQPPVIQLPSASEVCLYDRTRFRGESVCLGAGESIRDLGDFAERASSIDNPDGLRVQVCSDNYYDCRTYTTSASTLGDFDDYIVSVRVR